MHSGAHSRAKMVQCMMKKGTLHTKFAKMWEHMPPMPPVPTSVFE